MIRFPQRPIADNVTERIMKIAAQTNPHSVQSQGQRLDRALAAPVGYVAPIEGIEDAVALKALGI